MTQSTIRPSLRSKDIGKIPHLVFYDDKCSLCLKEINHYKKLNTSHPIKWVPIYQEEEIIQQYGFRKQDLLKHLHVVRGDGVVVTGAAAFATIWSSIKWYRPIGMIVYKLHLIPMLDIAYEYFAKWRFKRQTCEI
jgi:predicted DCC family thiol-disulfide oxidoreductase YuxK